MDRRLKLQELLQSIMGTNKVYFKSPGNERMSYPCIVYKEQSSNVRHADNSKYLNRKCYQITLMDTDVESKYDPLLEALPLCRRESPFTTQGIKHFQYTIYY